MHSQTETRQEENTWRMTRVMKTSTRKTQPTTTSP